MCCCHVSTLSRTPDSASVKITQRAVPTRPHRGFAIGIASSGNAAGSDLSNSGRVRHRTSRSSPERWRWWGQSAIARDAVQDGLPTGASSSASRLIVLSHYRIGIAGSAGAAFSLRGSSRTAWMPLKWRHPFWLKGTHRHKSLLTSTNKPIRPRHFAGRDCTHPPATLKGTPHLRCASSSDLNGLRDKRLTSLYCSGMVTFNRYRIHQERRQAGQPTSRTWTGDSACMQQMTGH